MSDVSAILPKTRRARAISGVCLGLGLLHGACSTSASQGAAVGASHTDDAPADGGAGASAAHSGDAGSQEPAATSGGAGSRAHGAGSGGTNASAGKPAADGGGSSAPVPSSRRSRELPDPEEAVLEPETADADALARLADWQKLPLLATGSYLQQSSHDRGQPNADEEALLPLFGNDNRDLNNFICKSDDAQLGMERVLPYLFDQASCTESYTRGVTLARYQGSGVLRRLWMTVSSLALPSGGLADEIFRVYVDDNPRPLLQVPLAKVLDGSAAAIFAPPFGSGSQHFIAWYYPVVFSSKLVITLDKLASDYYFQTDVVLDADAKPRVAPAARLPERDQALAQLMAATPTEHAPQPPGSLHAEPVTLAKAERRELQLSGPATIDELRLRVAKSKLSTLAGVNITAGWDGAKDAAIDVPLLDLFAASRLVVERSDLALASATDGDDQLLSLRLPMPFRSSADWALENTSDASVDFSLEWFGHDGVPDSDFGHLAVQRNLAMLPTMQFEQPVAHSQGRGRYVGMCADFAGHADSSLGLSASPLNFLEGDFRARVDDKLALDGTGTEDYPDNAFYFLDTPRATPFAQNWGLVNDTASRPAGQVSFCRWQVLGNEVDFLSSFDATIEISQRDPAVVDLHRTVAFLYLE